MDNIRSDLLDMRKRHGADSAIGHRCTNLTQTFKAYGEATDEKRQAELEKRIRQQFAELVELTGGMQ